MSKYVVTKELKTETKVGSGLYVKDFFFLIGYLGMSYMIAGAVHSNIRFLFYVFSVCVAVFLTLPSGFNKKRRNYQSLMIFFRRDNNLYRSVNIKRTNRKET